MFGAAGNINCVEGMGDGGGGSRGKICLGKL